MMDMRSMAAALAAMPEGERRTMLKERLLMFADMADDERASAMRQMMEAVATLPREDIKKLFKARFEVLFELPEATRMKLMQTHMRVLQEMGMDQMRREMELVQEVLPELSFGIRQAVEQMMKMMPMPAGRPAPQAVPPQGAPPVGMPGWGKALLWVVAAGGLWLVVWPFLFGFGAYGRVVANNVILGVGIGLVAVVLALAGRPTTEGWVGVLLGLLVLAGAWLVVSPFILNYGVFPAAVVIDIVSGVGVAALALAVLSGRARS